MILKNEGLKFELHVWGPELHALPDTIDALCLADRVFLRGLYAAAAPWAAYADIDLALLATTVAEPFGRIIPEAAASGIPAIGPAVGGIPESIRDDVDGLLYRFGDVDDLARQMRRVLTDPSAPTRESRRKNRPALTARAVDRKVGSRPWTMMQSARGPSRPAVPPADAER